MSGYLPRADLRFRQAYREVSDAPDHLGGAVDAAGPLDACATRLVKLGIAIGAPAEGAVRSNVRKSLEAGPSPLEIRQAALRAIATVGLPAAVAARGWIDEVQAARRVCSWAMCPVSPALWACRAATTSGSFRHPHTGPTLRSV